MRVRSIPSLVLVVACLLPSLASAQSFGFADVVVEYFDGGNGTIVCPEAQGGVFPPPATSPTCVPFSAALGDDPGPVSDYVSIPMGSFLTLGFVNDQIIDGPGDDLFIAEVGDAEENAEIYVSSLLSTDPADYTLIGIANGNTVTSFDLASIGFTGEVRAVKVLSLENGGAPSAPGFDLAHIEAINASVPVPSASALGLAALAATLLALGVRARAAR